MKKNRIYRVLAATALATAGTIAFSGTANAQLIGPPPCPSLVAPVPCIVFDYKKLGNIATTNAQEIAKIQETVQFVNKAKETTQNIVSEVRDIGDLKLDVRAPDFNKIGEPLFEKFEGNISTAAKKVGDTLFSGAEATVDDQATTERSRELLVADSNAEAFAYSAAENATRAKDEGRYKELVKTMCLSKDLRSDWTVNSQIRLEVLSLRAHNDALMTTLLRQTAASKAQKMAKKKPKGFDVGTIATVAVAAYSLINKSDKVDELQSLFGKASGLLGSLGVVQMTSSAQDTLRTTIADYDATVARKANVMSQFQSKAQEWRRKSGKGSAQNTINVVLSNLNSVDNQMASLRGQPVESLAGAFQLRNIDMNAMLQADVDPRQFIGTWGDPLKYKTTLDMSNTLLKGVLDSSLDGDSDNDEFRQWVFNYNDVRLEEAWKKVYADEARAELVETGKMIAEENTLQGRTVDEAYVKAQLEQIVARSNELAQEISASEDAGSKQRAAEILQKLQTLVGGGTSLPSGEVDGNGDPYTGAPTP